MAEFDTDFMVPNGTESNGTTHYDKVNFTTKASLAAMEGYAKAAEYTPITASDNALTAFGKLEKKIEDISSLSPTVSIDKDSLSISGPQGSADTVTVTTDSDGTINATSADTSIATVSVSGHIVTVTSVGEGSTTVTIQQAASSTYKASQIFDVSVNVAFISSTLNDNSWAVISTIAQAGEGELYWDVGDCKEITLNGNIGSNLNLSNQKLCVFILGFNHPVNGNNDNNIIFGGFKSSVSGGTDVALCDSQYGTDPTSGTIAFNMNHSHQNSSISGNGYYGTNYGGWKGTDFRYDILGATSTAPSQYNQLKSTSNVGYDATAATLTNPKANTLLAALPSDFRSALRLWTRYVDNKGNSSNTDANVTACVDAGVSLLTEAEIFASRTYANQYEQNHNSRLAYYAAGNSAIKKKHSDTSSAVVWWESSPYYDGTCNFCNVGTSGTAHFTGADYARGLAPAFKV